METQTKTTNNSMGIVAYLTIIGLVIAFVSNQNEKNEFVTYHIRQSLGIALTGFALGVIGLIPFVGWIVSTIGTLGVLTLWIMGLINAINHKRSPVPILGKKYEEWFASL